MTDTNSKAQVTDAMVEAACARHWPLPWPGDREPHILDIRRYDMRNALSAALAAQEKPEPGVVVAWVHEDFDKELSCYDQAVMFPNDRSGDGFKFVPLYLHPAPSPDLPEGDAVQTIAVPEGTRVIVKMGAACDMIIRHPKEDGRCPRSCNHRPDDFSMRDCIEAGECGCIAFPSPIDKGEVK